VFLLIYCLPSTAKGLFLAPLSVFWGILCYTAILGLSVAVFLSTWGDFLVFGFCFLYDEIVFLSAVVSGRTHIRHLFWS